MSVDRFGEREHPSSLTPQQLEILGDHIKAGLAILYVAKQTDVAVDTTKLNKDSSLRSE